MRMAPYARAILSMICILFCTVAVGLGCKQSSQYEAAMTEYYTPVPGMLPYFKSKYMNPWWPQAGTKNLEQNTYPTDLKKMPAMKLVTHDNEPFDTSSLNGKYVLVNFFFTSCHGICPALTLNMKHLLKMLPSYSDLKIISVTVDPQTDQPNVIKAFREKFKINSPDWTFLTGDQDQIFSMARTAFNADTFTKDINRDLRDFLHTENFYLLDKNLYLRGVYRAKGIGDLGRLVTELKTLKESE